MNWKTQLPPEDYYSSLPKIDLHRHLEGALRLETLRDLAREHGITLPARPNLRALVQMQDGDTLNFSTFLSKFQTLRLFYLSPEVISRITYEAVADAASDGVRYLELRFTPVALSRARDFDLGDVMDWVSNSAQEASRDFGITTRLIASINRHEAVELGEEVAVQAVRRIGQGITGLDLAGNEAEFPAQPFVGLFLRAKAGGLAVTIHAGEWGGAENVRQAIEEFHADRIGHGVRVLEDPQVVQLAAERGIPFEVCVTSNYQTGAVPALSDHPILRMLNAGLNVTVNTDDPSVSDITLSYEHRLVCEDLGMPRSILHECILSAANASFLTPPEKEQLADELRKAFAHSEEN